MGNLSVRTPAIDRLAREGVLFENHFVQAPQCVPSRAALATGRYPHVTRVLSNTHQLPPGERTLAHLLNESGYETAVVGEMPFAPTKFVGGYQTILAGSEDHQQLLESEGWAGSGVSAERRRLVQQYERQLHSPEAFQSCPVPWPEDLDETAFFARKAIQLLEREHQKPFFLHVNFRRPHHPFDPPAPFDRMYEGVRLPASHSQLGEMDGKPPEQKRALANSVGFDLRTLTPERLDRVKSLYYGMVSLNDKYIGMILDALVRRGLAGETLVIFNADHGEMLGDHGLLFKGAYFYDEVVRVPLILRFPGRLPAAKRVKAIVEEVDVLPTILDLLGISIPQPVQGHSLLPVIEGAQAGPGAAHSEFPTIKMLRTDDWKLVHYVGRPYGELYDLRRDPQELKNLYRDPSAAEARHEMEARLVDWLVRSADPSLPPNPAASG